MAEGPGKVQGERDACTRREMLARLGIDPYTGQQRPIQLAYEKLKSLPRIGRGKVMEAAYVLPDVLLRPSAIFEGLTGDADEPHHRGVGWLCYVGRPNRCFEDDGREIPAPENRVFLVFVNDEWVAYNWYWCEADPERRDLPVGYVTRFQRQLI